MDLRWRRKGCGAIRDEMIFSVDDANVVTGRSGGSPRAGAKAIFGLASSVWLNTNKSLNHTHRSQDLFSLGVLMES